MGLEEFLICDENKTIFDLGKGDLGDPFYDHDYDSEKKLPTICRGSAVFPSDVG